MKKNLLNLTITDLEKYLATINEKKFRATQILEWIYKKNTFDFTKMSNLSKPLQEKFSNDFDIKLLEIYDVANSSQDNSYKFLLKTSDGNLIESILMPIQNRVTICVSCMIGCPLKCKFCATGSQIKYLRNLETNEIIGQILAVQEYLHKNNISIPNITNVVFMGMGEPLLNSENVSKTIEILLHKNCLSISRNKITVSTAGITEGLADFINKTKIKLAVSLHFATDAQRTEFMPINKKYCLKELITELKKIDLGKRDFITIEYLMLQDINDSLNHAKELLKLLSGLKIKVNLIPYNPTESFSAQASTEDQINMFAKYINSKSIMVTVRRSKGKEVKGACGQFAYSNK